MVVPSELEERLKRAREQREASVESFVDGLEEIEQEVNGAYTEPVKQHGEKYAPFLFTKGMPLATDDDGARYPEGLVPRAEKLANYREPVRERENFSAGENFRQGGQRLFIGAPGVNTVGLSGMEAWQGRMPPAPDPRGPENAGEMIDLYAMEQLRDVPFTAWPGEAGGGGKRSLEEILADDSAPQALTDTLEALGEDLPEIESAHGEWWYGPGRLFVEGEPGSWGPYVSQFLLHEVELWSLPCEQRYLRYEAGVDHNQYLEDWLNTLEGRDRNAAETNPSTPSSPPPEENRGYLATPRHLATIVNAEPPYQEYLIAALRLLGKADYDEGLAHVRRAGGRVFGYTGSGPVGLLDVIARAGRQALLAAFYQKYHRHFRCRPETYGGRVHAQTRDRAGFGIPELLTGSATLAARGHETDYLSTAYVEGAPVHPAYPSGHSVIAGACGTVLKAWFRNEPWPLEVYVPRHEEEHLGAGLDTAELPSGHAGIHQEVDKLMSNVGLARMFAGVHYYSDHYWGVKLGEQVAVGLMADVFRRTFAGAERIEPTFRPYLEYDADPLPVNRDTLETLRRRAATA